MIAMRGRAHPSGLISPLPTGVWMIGRAGDPPDPGSPVAVLIERGQSVQHGHALYLTRDTVSWPAALPRLELPPELAHLSAGDVIAVSADGRRVDVLWKASARHNSILLTEQCDHYCLMCSQPPKNRDDSWLYERAERVIDLLPDSPSILLTGGEPTLNAEALLHLLGRIAASRPRASVHLLSNGRRFADTAFVRRYSDVGLRDIMVGVPIYAADPARHDYIVQTGGAFNETVRGILNLCANGQATELRIVLQKHNAKQGPALAEYIARNLPFVNQVVIMALEMTGLARPNAEHVWIDPADYQPQLVAMVETLDAARVPVRLYNYPLCVLNRRLWPYSAQSISDWKNMYLPGCATCAVRDQCGGSFSTSNRHSRAIEPFLSVESARDVS